MDWKIFLAFGRKREGFFVEEGIVDKRWSMIPFNSQKKRRMEEEESLCGYRGC
jgi:hypothetical protein